MEKFLFRVYFKGFVNPEFWRQEGHDEFDAEEALRNRIARECDGSYLTVKSVELWDRETSNPVNEG